MTTKAELIDLLNESDLKRRTYRRALQQIVAGDVDSTGTLHGTYSGSQCVEIARAALLHESRNPKDTGGEND